MESGIHPPGAAASDRLRGFVAVPAPRITFGDSRGADGPAKQHQGKARQIHIHSDCDRSGTSVHSGIAGEVAPHNTPPPLGAVPLAAPDLSPLAAEGLVVWGPHGHRGNRQVCCPVACPPALGTVPERAAGEVYMHAAGGSGVLCCNALWPNPQWGVNTCIQFTTSLDFPTMRT